VICPPAANKAFPLPKPCNCCLKVSGPPSCSLTKLNSYQDFMVPAIGHYYRDKEGVQRDEAMRSCGIAAQTLMLGARAMGYDSCPMDGFDFKAVSELIGLPEDHVVTMFVAIGKPLEPARPRGGQLPLGEVVIEDRFA
ncbi:MAG: nitroreductase family protein, partial [Magnetococcales bacterium]|nr:nitroreductase family protein [Magnetococcales bacterium]